MPDIRYVCLSDVHFGAENSLLSRLVEGDVIVDTAKASSVLDGLVATMAALIGANEDTTTKPTLVLNGDVLELALASDDVALMVFELFLDRIFPPTGEDLFDRTILYLPGNHDHHLWETARELQYANLLNELDPAAPLPIPWHATKLYYLEDTRPVYSELLEQLAKRQPHRQGVKFRVSYPNLGVRSPDGRTSVVFHHGHNVEAIYHLMSTLKGVIFPGRPEPTEVWDIEAENFAWIDFFWSTLGRSGQVGEDVGLIYDMLQSEAAIKKLAANLAGGIGARLPSTGAVGWLRWLIRPVLRQTITFVASKLAASERKSPASALPADAAGGLTSEAGAGLMAYLGGPLIKQLASESPHRDGTLPEQVKFVFGHTHKPAVYTRSVPGLANDVRIFNSGGWVVDSETVAKSQGVNLVLMDENLEIACVRMYNQAEKPESYRAKMDDGLTEEQGPFYQRLSEFFRSDDEVWRSFSAAVADLVSERQKALGTIIRNAGKPRPSGSPVTPPKAPAPPVPQTPSATLARGTDPRVDQSKG